MVYHHPERQVIFLGDFIDRGPKIRQVWKSSVHDQGRLRTGLHGKL